MSTLTRMPQVRRLDDSVMKSFGVEWSSGLPVGEQVAVGSHVRDEVDSQASGPELVDDHQ